MEKIGADGRLLMARVLVADDHELARAGLRLMLSAESDMEVVGEARTGREAVELGRMLSDPATGLR
jgi:DNA-binding NarL/FixJ family response regulator